MPSTLYLIDAYAQIFRAYYAIRGGMHSPVTSEPTHAVFGVTGMLLKLLSQYRPQYVAVAVDPPGPTFRDELYGDYKATRGATPEDLRAQIPRIFELVELFGIPLISYPGLEADDVIGCITRRVLADPSCADLRVRIVSKDKDLAQLIGPRVSLFDVHTDAEMDAAALLEARGVRPDQVVDLLALTGDSVDNVPGVEGIGPKTAAQLLQEHDSIEGIYEHIDAIKGKRRENLERARETLPLFRRLVTLQCEVDVGFSLEATRLRPLNLPRILALFQQLGFNRFQEEARRLAEEERRAGLDIESGSNGLAAGTPAVEIESYGAADYRAVTTAEALRETIERLRAAPMIAVDTETTGLGHDARLCGVSLAWEEGSGVYVPVRSPESDGHLAEEAVLNALRPVLEDEAVPKCGHNLKFDAHVLLRGGVRLRGVRFDSMLAASLLDPGQGSARLDNLALSLLNYRMIPITQLIGEGSEQVTMEAVPLAKVTPYAAEDADVALRLWRVLTPRLEEQGMAALLRDVEAPLSTVLAEMEANGILCDPEELERQGRELGARVEELKAMIHAAAGCEFDINSTRQLAEVLFDRIGLKAGKRTKTGRSTDVEVLEKLAAEEDRLDPRTAVPRLVLAYRQLAKLISTYLTSLSQSIRPSTGRIHTTFHQLVTATGRLASHGPNLQNIPVRTDVGRQIRKAFHAPEGHRLLCADYSQIELRLLAHLSQDAALLEAFHNDWDIHAAVASQVFDVPLDQVTRELRAQAKTINFGIIYGVTPYGLARRIEGMDVAAAGQLIADYRARYPGIDAFLQRCVQKALADGYVTTLLGRRRAIPEIHSTNAQTRGLGERLAINSVVQGSAADLIKVAMVHVQRRVDRESLPVKMLLQIHDELVFETPAEGARARADAVCQEMERAMELSVPLKVECGIGRDWLSAK
ncbi:MAG: DNA polymerase I [Chthonomonadales bacterium]|nr:DNA polymerase I [Chthonomonadales bacterium]